MGTLSRSNWTLEMLLFDKRRKPEYPEKNLSEQGREPTTNSTHIWRRVRESNPGQVHQRVQCGSIHSDVSADLIINVPNKTYWTNPASQKFCRFNVLKLHLSRLFIFGRFVSSPNFRRQNTRVVWDKCSAPCARIRNIETFKVVIKTKLVNGRKWIGLPSGDSKFFLWSQVRAWQAEYDSL